MEDAHTGQTNIRKTYPKLILNDLLSIEKTGHLNGTLESIDRLLRVLEVNSTADHYKLIAPVKDLVSTRMQYDFPKNLELAKKACEDYISNNSSYYKSNF